MLQSLAGWKYFPYVFGVFEGKLGMELISCEDKKSGNSLKHAEEKKTD